MSIPEGGCLKATEGIWHQIFDKDGNCVGQCFVDGKSDYKDASGKKLPPGDDRRDFFYPFATPPVKHQCPQFTCPDCGSHRLEEILTDVILTTEIIDVGPGGDLEYADGGQGDEGEVDRYQCLDCGHVIPDAKNSEELARALGVDATP